VTRESSELAAFVAITLVLGCVMIWAKLATVLL